MGDLFNGASFEDYEQYLVENVIERNPKIGKIYTKLDLKKMNVEDVFNDESLSKREFVELIASRRRIGYDPTVGGGNKAAEDETDRLYAKNPWKFVEEFLQNADDCEYRDVPEVDIIVDEQESTVEFVYNELGFTKRDIWAIAAFSQSTKNNDIVEYQANEGVFYREKTGRKGKGFKSVFSLKAENVIVQIRSNGYCFKLDNNIGRVLPVWEEDTSRMDGKTHVIVKLVNPSFDLNEIYPEFKELFCVERCEDIFAKSPFIFMHRIKSVHIKRIGKSGIDEFKVSYLEDKTKTLYRNEVKINQRKTILAGIANEGRYYEEQFQEGCIKITLNSKEKQDIQVVRYTRMVEDEQAYRNYSIMSPVLKNNDVFVCENGALFRTFPMSLHGFNMPMAIDAPFELNPDRSGIQYRDEKTDTINASDWNSVVSANLFEDGGVYEAFLLWIRTIHDIRMDKYIRAKDIVLFEDRSNLDSRGKDWVERINISNLSKNIPIFRLFADENEYVCFNAAEIVNKELFAWPCVDALFTEFFGIDYRSRIISNIYVGSSLFHTTTIDKEGFAESINKYLDKVEDEIGISSQSMFDFVNKFLYPFLVNNTLSIVKADADAFKKMKIYFSRLQCGNEVVIVRENFDAGTKWLNDSKAHISINRYRVIESSPVDMSIIDKIIKDYLWVRKIEIDFASNNINKTARNCKSWKDAYNLIEAACHFGADISVLYFGCLNGYVLSEVYDDETNAYRISGVKEIIPDEDIMSLSRYADSDLQMAGIIKKMGLKPAEEFFDTVGNYIQFREDTLELLASDMDLSSVLNNIKKVQKDSGKKINATYGEIKACKKSALAFLLDYKREMFPADTYATICDELQEDDEYWEQTEYISIEVLIRACAGSSKPVSNKDKRVIEINIDKALEHNLEYAIANIVSKNRIGELKVLPSENFAMIPNEEIQALLGILRPDDQQERAVYYKGNIGKYGSKKQYLKDGKGGHIYLNCDENGDYKKALEECVNKSFDTEALRVIDEMEHQYRFVKKDILEMLNRTGGDLSKTYDEIERRFGNYNNQQIISILSWFRYSGYTNALGNGNINNEKEIEDDYRNNPWKFVYEFIQNVDDCSFSEDKPNLSINIDKEKNRIIFEYNENGFTLDDVKALTKFGDSDKENLLDEINVACGVFDREKTGRKGRGFKSVFSLPGQGVVVHICSNGFSFKFVKRLGSIIPIWEDVENVPERGTRIIVEGFDSKYLPKLTDNMEKMFGISDMASFYSTCPILYLRKLNKVTVNNCGNSFSIAITPQKESQVVSDEIYDVKGNEIVAGIVKNNEYRKSLWERVRVKVDCNEDISEFDAVRYTEMFSDGKKTRIASVFAPFMNETIKIEFKRGALYRTLPLDDNTFGIPLSINAPFETNSGRSAVADISDKNSEVLYFVFTQLLKGFYSILREEDDVDISKYIPLQNSVIFKDYKNIEEEDLHEIIKAFPILKVFMGDEYVSCNDAEVLPSECYEWSNPILLAKCFSNGRKALVLRNYIGLGRKCIRTIDFVNEHFVENINGYLEQLNIDDEEMMYLLKNYLYPYIARYYGRIAYKYKLVDKKEELRNMAVFLFEMAEGDFVRESARINTIWMIDVPEGYESYGKYRNIGKSSISDIYISDNWIADLEHRIVSFDSAFTSAILKGNEVKTWEATAALIKTILYYDVKKYPVIPFLRECVLSAEFDDEKNLFRDGFVATGDEEIIKHIIDRDNLLSIAEITGKVSEDDLLKLAGVIKSMGLKDSEDFFEDSGKGLYQLNLSTIALLESYCVDRDACDAVVDAIDTSFRKIKSEKTSSQLRVIYEELENCNYLVIAKLFEFEVLAGEVRRSLAREFCELDSDEDSLDYMEAFLRALFVIGESPVYKVFNIALSDIIERELGECIQVCKINNLDKLELYIETEGEIKDYPSAAIDKALQWLEDESKVSATYCYYTTDLKKAFPGNKDAIFIFDEEKVILNADNDENSMLEFVQKRYKSNDASFKSLVQIITQQNNLKSKWHGTKEEYIKCLSEFRESTWKQRKVLLPNYDEYINNANGQSEQYVIPELLQNINDCKFAPNQGRRILDVNINVGAGTMMLRYDEVGFDYENVYSITAIGQSSKHDKSEGEKGLGFKKVFTIFNEVEIYSNGFCFKLFAGEKNTVPKWIASKEKQEKYLMEGKTMMIFTAHDRFRNKLEDLLKTWKSIMKGEYVGSEVSPIFLSNIHQINVAGCEESYLRTKMEDEYMFKSIQILPMYKKLLMTCESEAAEEDLERILEDLKQRRKCQSMYDEQEILKYLDELTFEMALPKKVGAKQAGKGCFYSTLPTKINLDVPMFMNIPLELTTGRDGKVDSSVYNKAIMKMIFKPYGDSEKSLFTLMLEEYARENQDVFMTDYFAGDFEKFLYEIADRDEDTKESIKESLNAAKLFVAYNLDEMVSLGDSFSVDRIICQYLLNVDSVNSEIFSWLHKHTKKVAEYSLILPKKIKDCDALEKFARDVESCEGYFPIKDASEDLALRYLMEEYGYEGGEDIDE